jgi:hypothetical protein
MFTLILIVDDAATHATGGNSLRGVVSQKREKSLDFFLRSDLTSTVANAANANAPPLKHQSAYSSGRVLPRLTPTPRPSLHL